MSKLLIKIRWHQATEFLSLDPDRLPSTGTFLTSTEYWEEERQTVKYTVLCASVKRSGSTIELTLEYDKAKNRSLIGLNEAWGRSTLRVDLANMRASARWTDSTFKDFNGAAHCSILEDALLDEYTHEQVARLKRPKQSAIRLQLLQMYGRCALTGETTPEVLDAVHIIEAASSGANTKANCFLLRTDLHRLFDRALLTFTPGGAVILAKGVGDQYEALLSGRELAAEVLENVRAALAKRFAVA